MVNKSRIIGALALCFIAFGLVFFPLKSQAFEDSYSGGRAQKIKVFEFSSIQNEMDAIYLQLRSGDIKNILSIYIPKYGAVFNIDYILKVSPPYLLNSGTENEKQNYIKMTSVYHSILRRINESKYIQPEDFVHVNIKTENMFIQRKIRFKHVQKIFKNNSEFNIIQSILKYESDPKVPKRKIISDIATHLKYRVLNYSLDDESIQLTLPESVMQKVKEKTGFNIVATYLKGYAVVVQVTDNTYKDEDAKEIIEKICDSAYKSLLNVEKCDLLIVSLRRQDGLFGANMDIPKYNFSSDLQQSLTWWEFQTRRR